MPPSKLLTGIGFSCTGPSELDDICWARTITITTEPHGRRPEMGDGQTPDLLRNAVLSKISKLRRNNCVKPWILVIEDDYSWGDDVFEKHLPDEASEYAAIFKIANQSASLIHGSVL